MCLYDNVVFIFCATLSTLLYFLTYSVSLGVLTMQHMTQMRLETCVFSWDEPLFKVIFDFVGL